MNLMKVTGKITGETSEGELKVMKKIVLIEALTFTEAEAVALEYLQDLTNFPENTEVEKIEKVKYSGLSLNDCIEYSESITGLMEHIPIESDISFWELTVGFEEEAANGKVKVVKEKFLMPEETQKRAITKIEEELVDVTFGYKIPNGKMTDFYSILVSKVTHNMLALKAGLPTVDEGGFENE